MGIEDPSRFALSSDVGTMLVRGRSERNLVARGRQLYEWVENRYAHGVEPYQKISDGRIGPIVRACDRKGRPLTGAEGSVNFASQDYLGLSSHPDVAEAAMHAIREYGVHSAGSAALMGMTQASQRLERALADFTGYSDVTLFPTGWAAGFGIVRTLVSPGDTVVLDKLAHACLKEAALLSTRPVVETPHLDVDAMIDAVAKVRADDAAAGILVVTESLFSMDSDTPDLVRLQQACRDHDATLVIDCAHDLGAMADDGLGLTGAQGLMGKADILMGSFSKTFASNGGFVATNFPELKPMLRYACGPSTFSNALSPVQAATVQAALSIVRGEEGRARRARVLENAKRLRVGLEELGATVIGEPSPIVPVVVGGVAFGRIFARTILDLGSLVNLVEYPAVSRSGSRLRLQVMSEHTAGQVDQFLELFGQALQLTRAAGSPSERPVEELVAVP